MRVQLNGYVVEDTNAWIYKFFGFGVICPRDVRDALANNPEGEDLIFEVNSPGGDVYSGFEIYSAIRAARRERNIRVVAEVQSIAASAASTLIEGCSQVLMAPVAQMMIHLPSTTTSGDAPAHLKSVRLLESVTASIINAYELRSAGKLSRERLNELVRAETWMTAQEAVAAGLADGILYADGEAPLAIPERVTNALGGGIRALALSAGAMPSPENLRALYQELVDQGKAPAMNDDGTPAAPAGVPEPTPASTPQSGTLKDDWRNLARVELSKKRFCVN